MSVPNRSNNNAPPLSSVAALAVVIKNADIIDITVPD
jgi:hypothetical protein